MWLLVIALFGLVVPNGLFLYWVLADFTSIADVVADRLAIAFIIDAFMAVGLLAYLFAARPLGPVKWYWFVILSLIGGLGFASPLFTWLNRRATSVSAETAA